MATTHKTLEQRRSNDTYRKFRFEKHACGIYWKFASQCDKALSCMIISHCTLIPLSELFQPYSNGRMISYFIFTILSELFITYYSGRMISYSIFTPLSELFQIYSTVRIDSHLLPCQNYFTFSPAVLELFHV